MDTTFIPILQTLGQKLRQAREAKGLSLEGLAKQLHMGIEQLEALETGDPDRQPEAVFVIAQARRVASRLGICIDEEVDSLRQSSDFVAPKINLKELKFQPQQADQDDRPTSPTAQAPGPKAKTQANRPLGSFLRNGASLALIAGLAVGAHFLWQQWQSQQKLIRQQTLAREAVLKKVQQKKAKLAAAQALQASQAKQLFLISDQGSWLEVKTPQGQRLFRGAFQGRKTFPLARGVLVLAGRPDLVLVQLGNSPAKPLGTVTDIKWLTFTATEAKPGVLPAPAKPAPAKPLQP